MILGLLTLNESIMETWIGTSFWIYCLYFLNLKLHVLIYGDNFTISQFREKWHSAFLEHFLTFSLYFYCLDTWNEILFCYQKYYFMVSQLR